ncbi:sensor histidine kinase [Sphingomonas aracearum]|uniref:histidine kinase n=1 Tax=Sphingomonas aracearum TaxID=2283317 RepID=A0A369W2D3_9SPHN|nr:sensor histidine kinase [Sphingomonas aracearum]
MGAQIAWRQLVDLVGRGRVSAPEAAIARLRTLRDKVPAAVRSASARAVAAGAPQGAIVGFFAEDDAAVAAPVLRTGRLADKDWIALLPGLAPGSRAVLRHRRDLGAAVRRSLESFGPVDFVLPAGEGAGFGADAQELGDPEEAPAPAVPEPVPDVPQERSPEPALPPAPSAPQSPGSFVAFGHVARELPVVAEALRHAGSADREQPGGTFRISDLVARIDAYRRRREEGGEAPEPVAAQAQPAAAAESFRFETDQAGTIRWVDIAARAALVGLSLDLAAPAGLGRVDASAGGAFRGRQPFSGARLEISGRSPVAGSWRLSAVPVFAQESGRFTGYRGVARRPRREESAASPGPAPDALRQLVHELRTPTNAISGFAEMIEVEMLGPVPPPYREQAQTIRRHAGDLLAAIEDVDLAARLRSRRLELRAGTVPLTALLTRVAEDLAPLASLRGATLVLPTEQSLALAADEGAAERLAARLMATLMAACARGEALIVSAEPAGEHVALAFSRPAALAGLSEQALLTADEDAPAQAGAPLLGTGFALRLVRNLSVELGGALDIAEDRLTLRLPAAVIDKVARASAN